MGESHQVLWMPLSLDRYPNFQYPCEAPGTRIRYEKRFIRPPATRERRTALHGTAEARQPDGPEYNFLGSPSTPSPHTNVTALSRNISFFGLKSYGCAFVGVRSGRHSPVIPRRRRPFRSNLKYRMGTKLVAALLTQICHGAYWESCNREGDTPRDG